MHGASGAVASWLAAQSDAAQSDRERSGRTVVERTLRGGAGHDNPAAVMRENIRLVSSAGTGFTYYTTKNKRTQTTKLEIKKYDPVARKHVPFKESKMPPHSK